MTHGQVNNLHDVFDLDMTSFAVHYQATEKDIHREKLHAPGVCLLHHSSVDKFVYPCDAEDISHMQQRWKHSYLFSHLALL